MGTIIHAQQGIQEVFSQNYRKFYNEQAPIPGEHIEAFSDRAALTQLTNEDRDDLGRQVTEEEEIKAAPKELATVETPWTDRVPADFYQT